MELEKITKPKFDLELDMVYATNNNVTGKALYKEAICYLHPKASKCLKDSIKLAKLQNLRIKIFDAFRPLEAQKELWNKFPDPEFVSNPDNGNTPHCRGIAIDMTLIDNNLNELDMGTEFDAFTPLSHHGNTDISKQAQENRLILLQIMKESGWEHNPNEWWHYQLPFPKKYKKLSDKEAQTNMI